MQLYRSNSTAKIYLAILGLLIVITTMLYSQYLAKQLKEREEATMELLTQAFSILALTDGPQEDNIVMESLILDEFHSILPTIMEDESGGPTHAFVREDGEWRMVHHHAGPAAGPRVRAESTPVQ